jgi:hypothetical protein
MNPKIAAAATSPRTYQRTNGRFSKLLKALLSPTDEDAKHLKHDARQFA